MAFNMKYVGSFVTLVLIGLIGNYGYFYFFDTRTPNITIDGLHNNHYYAQTVTAKITANKSGTLSITLDDTPLLTNHSIKKSSEPYQLTLDTDRYDNAPHTLRTTFVENTFAQKTVQEDRTFIIDNRPLQVSFASPDAEYSVLQGRTAHIQFHVNKDIKEATIEALSQDYTCFPESRNSSTYECYIPISADQVPNEYPLQLVVTDNVGTQITREHRLNITPGNFKKQHLHIEKEKIAEEKTLGMTIAQREQILEELAHKSPQEKLWNGSFCTPIDIQRTTCEFGTIRTTQEKGRYKHTALDIINMPKSVVWATQNGIIALKDRFEDSGNTIVIDHGHGVLSLFYHLDNFAELEVGQKVVQGNPIGTLGKTGYANGYHLHWEMRLNNTAIDPMQWTQSTF